MNPSGDFGKKELSPALRNRMTEIWVESYFLQKELLQLYKEPKTHLEVPSNIDLYLIIRKMSEDKLKTLSSNEVDKTALVLFNMIGFVNITLS